ncbi:GDP-mannose 4,6-dehydratase [Rhodanobacter sp. B2A1Ga4]|uniref:NAD-dependent epimerase/dehydratase family protein n=1 Tax=Rhodanobacter sp. B2A1Ga4 TaxID=2778647 RepID=UPI001B39A93C|nr:NAD-dependent epimerase/dehydratase family protein [Rhodanobacter sp. B2A1Ga4]MBQ4854728.1 GDP-mannose 4,6-dehydratase [Rhodanobacter sp. B2A1Ga4]
MTRPRALLTGRSGFTGHYVARELEQAGYEVVGLSNGEHDESGSIQADLLDREALHQAVASVKPDVVLHLAAIAFVAHGDVDEMYRVNVVGTRNLLDALAAAEHKPGLVVLASSANVYGNAGVEPITEDTPPAPANDYAVSKLAMEYMAQLWMDKLPIVITRPFNYTGVGQSGQFLIPKIVDHFRRGARVIELGNVQVARDFSDVRDVAKAYAAIVKAAPAGEILNICSGVGHSLGDVLDMMAEIAGYRIEVRVNPAFVRSNDVARLVGSHSRLTERTGWRGQYGLPQTLAWQYQAGSASAQ